MAINRNGSGCVCAGISNDNGEIKTGVYVLDFSSEKPVKTYEIAGDYIIDGKYISSNRAALVGGSASYVVKTDDGKLETVDYGGKPLQSYCFNPPMHTFSLALSKSGDGRSCALITYNDNGGKKSEADSEYGCDSLSSYKDTIAALDGNMIYAYSSGGKLKYSCFAGTGAKRLILSSDSEAFVLSVNQIRKIDLTRQSSPDSVN